MKSKLAASFGLIVGLLIVCMPMFAHHGGSDYDTANPVTLKGTVTEFNWTNPHCQILIDVKGDGGKVVNWAVETLAPAVLKRAGWSPKSMQAGDKIAVTVSPSKRGTPVGTLRKVVLADGTELSGGQIGEQARP